MEVFIELLEVLLVADFTPGFILYHKYQYSKHLPSPTLLRPARFCLFAVENKYVKKNQLKDEKFHYLLITGFR